MNMKNIVFCLILILYLSMTLVAQPKGEPIVIGESFTLTSKILNEERPYLVYLPDDYESDGQPVSVLYLLDGRSNFHHTSGSVSFLVNQGRMPRTMVVAIPNTQDRTRDLTPKLMRDTEAMEQMTTAGGADNMLSFISDELIPHIEKNYNTNDYKLLIGHSFGGLFALHALLTSPDLFDGYVSISPSLWWDNQRLVEETDKYLDSNPELDAFFYMTMGNEGGDMLGGAMKVAALFEENSPEDFKWDFKVMKEETHGSVPYRSTYYGLEKIFGDWYNVDLKEMYTSGGMDAIESQYKKISDRLGYTMSPSEGGLNTLGYQLMASGSMDKAIDVFEANVKRHPKSYNTYDSLGEALMKKGDKKSAIKQYKKSVDIHPGNINGVRMLQEMGENYDPLSKPYNLSSKKLQNYIGTYDIPDAGELSFTIEGNELIVKGENMGMPTQNLIPVYEDGFVAKPTNILVLFQRTENKEISGFEAHIGPGQVVKGMRK